jgi:peptidoglycan/LPS O-acetylase OafA/YrhL
MSQDVPGRLGAGDCERLRDGCVAQPVNTATSGGYVATGALVAARYGTPGAPRAGEARAFGAVLALVGAGSIAYHGPQPAGAKWLHDLPIVAMIGLVGLTPAARLARGHDPLPGWSVARALATAGLFAAGGAAYSAGRTGSPTCDPDSRWQWHGAWHLLSAAGFVAAGELLYGSREGRPDGVD